MSENNATVIDCTYCINKEMLCSGSNDVNHVSEEVLNSLDGQIERSVDLLSI
jgi:hypothetical protein